MKTPVSDVCITICPSFFDYLTSFFLCRLKEGDAAVLLPMLHFSLLDHSPHVAAWVKSKVRTSIGDNCGAGCFTVTTSSQVLRASSLC